MDTGALDLTQSVPARGDVLEARITLTEPQSRLRVRLPASEPGRAEAVFSGRSWAAKHYWQEQPGLWVYEFDEPLPPEAITLRIPFARAR
jgi:hypothetical protein